MMKRGQSCLCLCGPIDKLKTDSIYNFHSISNNHQRERFGTFEQRTTCLPIFSLSPHYGTVKPCHLYQLFCSKSWPWPRNRPKVIKRSINSPFTFDRHSRFLVVTREQTWESVWQKIEDWDIPFAGGAKVSKKEQIAPRPQWGRTDGGRSLTQFQSFWHLAGGQPH